MKAVTKVVKRAPADRESLIDSIVQMRFPEYLDAEEAVEERLALDRSLAQELENIAQQEWSEGSGLTASQHDALRAARELASELKAMRLHQLKIRYDEEIADRDERRAFFNKAEAKADFTYWAKADCWTLEEAVALCLDREPKAVNTSTLEPWRERSKFVAQFERNLDLARRAQHSRSSSRARPPQILFGLG